MESTPPWMKPVFFRRNRVFRVYLGGKLYHDFLGEAPEDSNEPEEWICSSVRAINPGHTDLLEGLSLREEDGVPFNQILEDNPREYLGDRKDLGVLVKYLDSAIRLPMQVHPTRQFSKIHFGSPYGKAEAWLILATRPDACIYFGFSREVSREEFVKAIEDSENDANAMTAFVNRVPVETGDVFFVDAGVIHAIGAGCMLLEIQEPTDFTIQPEYWCGDYHLNDQEMYLGLAPELAVECFHFHRFGHKVIDDGKKVPTIIQKTDSLVEESLIGPNDTPCFSMNRFTLNGGELSLDTPASVWICTEGKGTVIAQDFAREIKMGDYFFLPAAAAGHVTAMTHGTMKLVCCVGGE